MSRLNFAKRYLSEIRATDERSMNAKRRYTARFIDSWSMVWLFSTLLGWVIPNTGQIAQYLVIPAMTVALQVLAEAALIARFSTTPGKYLCGISVRDSHGAPLPFKEALQRSWLVMLYGQALNIFFLTAFAEYHGYKAVRTTGRTSWDHVAAPSFSGFNQKQRWLTDIVVGLTVFFLAVPLVILLFAALILLPVAILYGAVQILISH